MHEYVAAIRHTLPDFSPRLAFGCRFGAVRQKLIARNFTVACLRLPLRRGQAETHCPVFHRGLHSVAAPARPDRNSLPGISSRLAFGCRFGAAGQKIIARNFIAAFHRCMSMSRLPVIRCPIFHRALHSVVASARSGRNSLPGISPRLAFGCRFGAVRQKLIARNFTAAFHRCMSMSRLPVIRCPIFHRALPSVAASARSGRNSLPGTSTRPCFGA